jgi:hypothetical protein
MKGRIAMKRKTLALAAVGAAMSLMLVSTSLAGAATFNTEKPNTTVRAAQSNTLKWSFNFGSFTCGTATLEGQQSATSSPTLAMTAPNFQNCKWSGMNMPVETQGCGFVYRADTASSGGVDISCAAGKAVRILGPGCTVSIGSQSLGGIGYSGQGTGSNRTITFQHALSGIRYSQSGFLCTNGTFSNGTISGSMLTWALNGTGSEYVGIWLQ